LVQVPDGCSDVIREASAKAKSGDIMKRTTIKRAAIIAAATAAAGIAALAFGTAAEAAVKNPTLNGKVAYVRGGAIYVTDGFTETRLTEDEVNSRPRFAPDGSRIAYVHNGTIWVMNADGSGKRAVSDRIGAGASWSPDGRSIAFAALSCTGGPGVYRVSSTQAAPTPEVLFPASCRDQDLPEVASIMGEESTPAPKGPALADKLRGDTAVAWSPDGTKIAFTGGECEDVADTCLTVGTIATGREIAIDVYGGGGSEQSGFGVVPAWRADSKKVTWTAYTEDAAPVHLMEADANGANRHEVGTAQDREMVYAGNNRGVLTATTNGRPTITVLDLTSGKRTALRTGSQPTIA
jgi:Tol biopolymer transport system component